MRLAPQDWIAVNTAGAAGREYVLRRRPHVILWYNSAGLAEPHYLSDHELADDPLFRLFYTLRVAVLPPAPGAPPDAALRRFLGYPFGYDPSGVSSIPDLGLRLRFRASSLGLTSLEEGSLRIVYVELDAHDGELWEIGQRLRGDLPAFADAVAERREEQAVPADDPAARAKVEALSAGPAICPQSRGAVRRALHRHQRAEGGAAPCSRKPALP